MQNSAESQFFKELIEKYLPPAPAKPDPDKVKTFIILSKLRSNIPPPDVQHKFLHTIIVRFYTIK